MTVTKTALAVAGIAGCGLVLAACGGPAASSGASAPAASSPSPSASSSVAPSVAPSASPAVPSAAAPGASARSCARSQIAVTLTHTGAVGGQAGGYLTFTNRGASACQISGWPGVTGVTATGASAVLAHARSTMFGAWQYSAPPPVVDLAPGASAYAVVAADDHPAGNTASCPAPYARLRVTVPGSPVVTTVSAWLPGANSYLPTCASVSGAPTDEVSDIVPLSKLAH